MEDVNRIQRLDIKNLTAGIRNKEGHQIKLGYSTPLINNLETDNLFKDKNKEEKVGVIDLINRILQVLKEDLYWIRISVQNTGLIEPVEL